MHFCVCVSSEIIEYRLYEVQALETTKYKFVETRFGGNLLVFNGYCYRRKNRANKRSYWLCCKIKCEAKGILQGNGTFKLTYGKHSHEPDFKEIAKRETQLQLKKLALRSNVSGRDLLKILGITDDTEKYLRYIRSWRCRNKKQKPQKSNA